MAWLLIPMTFLDNMEQASFEHVNKRNDIFDSLFCVGIKGGRVFGSPHFKHG